jgi:hypothetical protein
MERVIKPAGRRRLTALTSPERSAQLPPGAAFDAPTLVLFDAQHRVIGTRRCRWSRREAAHADMDTGAARLFRLVGTRGAIERRESLFNAATRIPTQLLGIDKLTSAAYDNLIIKLGGMLTPETVKAGMGHDYGIPEAVSDRRDLMWAHQRTQLREVRACSAS